jgi:hypothetical protein
MADFLTRLAGRTLGLAATVQPIIAPMYAAGQQFVEAGDGQEVIRDAWGAINRAPTDFRVVPDGPPSGNMVEQTVHAPEMLLPLVPQENQPPIISIQVPHTASRTPGGQPATWHRISLERDEAASSPEQLPAPTTGRASEREALSLEQSTMSDRKGPHLYEESGVGDDGQRGDDGRRRDDGRRKRPLPTSAPLPPLREESGVMYNGRRERPLPTSSTPPPLQVPLVPLDADVLPVQRLPVPTIQVTIGRIEVRATPPPAPRSQPRRSEPAVMGLEEYLKQRAKGGY